MQRYLGSAGSTVTFRPEGYLNSTLGFCFRPVERAGRGAAPLAVLLSARRIGKVSPVAAQVGH